MFKVILCCIHDVPETVNFCTESAAIQYAVDCYAHDESIDYVKVLDSKGAIILHLCD